MQIICLGQDCGIRIFFVEDIQQPERGFSFAAAEGLKRHHIEGTGLNSRERDVESCHSISTVLHRMILL